MMDTRTRIRQKEWLIPILQTPQLLCLFCPETNTESEYVQHKKKVAKLRFLSMLPLWDCLKALLLRAK